MEPYNGHKSWDYWNVSLWISSVLPQPDVTL